MSTKSSGSITLANILAITGLMLFGVFTYFGQTFLSAGEMGTSLLWAIAFTAIGSTLVVLMIVAKGKDEFPRLWRPVEFVSLGLYVVFMALTFRGPVRFFTIMSDKSELKQAGENDIATLRQMFTDYEAFETAAVTKCETGLLNVVNNPLVSNEVEQFLHEKVDPEGQGVNAEKIHAYCDKQREKLLKAGYTATMKVYTDRLETYRQEIKEWNVFRIPAASREMAATAAEIADELTQLSASGRLPVISRECDIVTDNQVTNFDKPSLTFADEISRFGTGNVWAWLGLIILHLLVIGGYLLSPRTLVTQAGAKLKSGTVL